MALLTIENLSFIYKGGDKYALKNINLEIEKGEFIVICGASGTGKTTLLRLLKPELAPNGERQGKILIGKDNLYDSDKRFTAEKIGFVRQNPDNQIVTDKVYHELAFGLECLGEKKDVIRKRIAEISQFFGINEWYEKNTCELSGGEKQLLNLASVMVMNPDILIFDEPTGQLDPIAADKFLHNVERINRELGITVIMAEHRLETAFSIADKILLMLDSSVGFFGSPTMAGEYFACRTEDENYKLMPACVKLFLALGSGNACPTNILEAQRYLREYACNNVKTPDVAGKKPLCDDIAVELRDVFFRYTKNGDDVLKAVSLKIHRGEIYAVVGGNGSGKSTLLKAIADIIKPYSGKIKIKGKNIKAYKSEELYYKNIAMLAQNPAAVFVKDKVIDDLDEIAGLKKIDKTYFKALRDKIVEMLSIEKLLERHPYDLSGGEMQKAALAKVLLLEPEILLLDEATKGLDNIGKEDIGNILQKLQGQGVTVIMVTHDIEFAAEYSTRVGMMFAGDVVAEDYARDFFAGNRYYTTAAGKIAAGYYDNVVTVKQLIELAAINKKYRN